ncbi:C40 family peptidase [Nocardioides mangrovi]|uniref:C40 family peptidase n=1 Tax=Nocardioides mangrovi TaxID=2874580 RepID=A0ABS7U9J8_9ACTN|nr:NlpC/P60 family protein [Nocardioides mangrovi]MBZ5737525.1 C40 family peptidase [Nocardioides mangrovi]
MSTTLPSMLRACSRTGVRLAFSGALAIGPLTSAPVADAHAATATHTAATTHHAAKHHHKKKRTYPKVAAAMRVAAAQKGDPYAYGAAGPGRFDCSGLTYYSFRHAGFSRIPRTSSAQAHFARRITRAHMHRGDLMFFYDGGGVYHVGVFAGRAPNGTPVVLHAPYSGTRVRLDRVWTNSWFPGTLRAR